MPKINMFTVKSSDGDETFFGVYNCKSFEDIYSAYCARAQVVIIEKSMKSQMFWNSLSRAFSAVRGGNVASYALGKALGDDEYTNQQILNAAMESIRHMLLRSDREIPLDDGRILMVEPDWKEI